MKQASDIRNATRLRVVALHTVDESFDVQELIDEHGSFFKRDTGVLRAEAWAFGSLPLIILGAALGADASMVDPSTEVTFGDPVGGAMVILGARMGLLPAALMPQFPCHTATVHNRATSTARVRYHFDAGLSPIAADIQERIGAEPVGELGIVTGAAEAVVALCDRVYRMGVLNRLDDDQKKRQVELAASLSSTGHRICAVAGSVCPAVTGEYPSSENNGLVWFGMISVTPAPVVEISPAYDTLASRITRTIRAITRVDIPRIEGRK